MDIVEAVATALQSLLGDTLDQLARTTGLVIRQRKFRGRDLLRILLFTLLDNPHPTTHDFFVTAIQLHLDVSQAAVAKRFLAQQPLTDFLRQALETALQQVVAAQPDVAGVLATFTAVHLGDSTVLPLADEFADLFPGCGGTNGSCRAALKLQVRWDLKTGRLEQLLIETGRAADATSDIAVEEAEPGTLLIYDLGYFDIDRFVALAGCGAYFLSRFQFNTKVFDAANKPLDLVAFLRQQSGTLVDVPLRIGSKQRLECRLVAVRVPEEVANRRRQQARQKAKAHGREPTAAYLELLGWSLFVTNAAEVTWQAVVVLYRARWQIELLFKLWKSHNVLGETVGGATGVLRLGWLYARLLGVLLQHWLLLATAWQQHDRSLRKAAAVLQREWKNLMRVLEEVEELRRAVARLRWELARLARVVPRPTDPTHAQLIEDPSLLDWGAEVA